MVTATQNNHMWAPRRDFWLALFEEGRISEAWVAFGSAAREYARNNLMRSGATDINKRFGRQQDRGGNTSLLIMKIGNKTVVDGCHSYKTHIFSRDEDAAPQLYSAMSSGRKLTKMLSIRSRCSSVVIGSRIGSCVDPLI
jgi:hypothetical protein